MRLSNPRVALAAQIPASLHAGAEPAHTPNPQFTGKVRLRATGGAKEELTLRLRHFHQAVVEVAAFACMRGQSCRVWLTTQHVAQA